jgi:large subunit ribosomal protein L3
MSIGLIGKKIGMTRIFTDIGKSIPVTVIEIEPNLVSQIKTVANDGYKAVQITTGVRKTSRLTKAEMGHFAKAGIASGRKLVEFRIDEIDEKEEQNITLGSPISVDIFQKGQRVDITGTSIGKGFQGGIKRHHFHRQDTTHGNSLSHRSNGSIGQNQSPGKVFKGKKMSGHMGSARRTIQNLEVIDVKTDRDFPLILVRGGVPGAKGSDLIINAAVKSSK